MQGQLKAAFEQLDTGRTEANRAHDKRVLRQLLLVHARVKLANGELPAAADALKLWLEDASRATAADAVTVAGASMQYAGAILALSAAFGAVGGAARALPRSWSCSVAPKGPCAQSPRRSAWSLHEQ
jgi:hypothetical protein